MADQKINELPTKTAPSTGDKMLMIGAAEEYQIDYDKLASAILDKLATKQYSELDTTAKTVLGALDELNSNMNLYVDSISGFKGFLHNINVYTTLNIYCTGKFMSEITDNEETSTARGIFSRSSDDLFDFLLLIAGSPSKICSFRYNVSTDALTLKNTFSADN